MKMKQSVIGSKQSARGFALTEVLLYVAIGAVLIGGSFLAYRTITKDAEADRQVSGIVDFVAKGKETFGLAGGNWASYTPANLIKMNRIPPQFTKDASAGKVFDAFGTEVVFGAASAAEGVASFVMRSPEECTKITQSIADLAYTASVGTSGAETVVKTSSAKLDVALMATGCAASTPVLKLAMR